MSIQVIKRKSGNRYWVRYRDANGRQRTKVFRRHKDAQTWEREQLHKRDKVHRARERGERPPKEKKPSLETVGSLGDKYVKYKGGNIAYSTRQRYQGILNKYIGLGIGEIRLDELETKELDEFLLDLQINTELSSKTINMILHLLKSILKWGVKRRFLPYNPADPLEALPVKNVRDIFWTEEEIERFLTHHRLAWFYALVLAALNTGMRVGELVGLKWDMVNLERREIYVERTWCNKEGRVKDTTKSKKGRIVPINDTLYLALAERKLRGEDSVFTREDGRPVDTRHFTPQVFRPACREAGVRDIGFHILRHTYASHFIMNDGNPRLLQEVMGHHSFEMTQRYTHLNSDFRQRAAQVVEFGREKEKGEVVFLDATKAGSG